MKFSTGINNNNFLVTKHPVTMLVIFLNENLVVIESLGAVHENIHKLVVLKRESLEVDEIQFEHLW